VEKANGQAPKAVNPELERIKREGGTVTTVASAVGMARHEFAARLHKKGLILNPAATISAYVPTELAIKEKIIGTRKGTRITPKGIAKLLDMGVLP